MTDSPTQTPAPTPPPSPEWFKITLASLGGMATSLVGFTLATLAQYTGTAMRGQLVAGDPAVNQEYPTMLNAMQASVTGHNPIVGAMSSYMWWIGVVLGGAVCAWLIMRMWRRA